MITLKSTRYAATLYNDAEIKDLIDEMEKYHSTQGSNAVNLVGEATTERNKLLYFAYFPSKRVLQICAPGESTQLDKDIKTQKEQN